MSRHPSLKVSALGSKKRSVLTRLERIEQLKIERRWKKGDGVTGLPKTRVIKWLKHRSQLLADGS